MFLKSTVIKKKRKDFFDELYNIVIQVLYIKQIFFTTQFLLFKFKQLN